MTNATGIQDREGSNAGTDAGWAGASDGELVAALVAGDETAFVFLLESYQDMMLRVATCYVSSAAVAREVVQETWLRLLRSLGRFEGRCSLKTWLFHILTNCAQTYGKREARYLAFATFESTGGDHDPSVDPDSFLPPEDAEWPGHWRSAPRRWDDVPEERLLSRETRSQVEHAVAALPPSQRSVITLRDIAGWTAEEVCNALEISDTNQRVLLHRARAKVRQALDRYLAEP